MKIVVVKYKFVLDPQASWAYLSEFEHDLVEFFKTKGIEIVIAENTSETGDRYIFLHKADFKVETLPTKKTPMLTPKEALAKLGRKTERK